MTTKKFKIGFKLRKVSAPANSQTQQVYTYEELMGKYRKKGKALLIETPRDGVKIVPLKDGFESALKERLNAYLPMLRPTHKIEARWAREYTLAEEKTITRLAEGSVNALLDAERAKTLAQIHKLWEESDKAAMKFAEENSLSKKDVGYVFADMKLQFFERKLKELEVSR